MQTNRVHFIRKVIGNAANPSYFQTLNVSASIIAQIRGYSHVCPIFNIDGKTCDQIHEILMTATDNTNCSYYFFTINSSLPAQEVLTVEILRISHIKDPSRRLTQFLALIAVFQRPLFWIMDTETSGSEFKTILNPLLHLYKSLMHLSNSALRIDEGGRRYVTALVTRFAKNIAIEPSPLFYDNIYLDWQL